jgi:hypothetical protein
MTFFAISMPCLPPGHSGRVLRHCLLALVLACLGLLPLAGPTTAQDGDLARVRGNLYESPAFGFIVMLPQDGGWQFQAAGSDADGDYVQAIHPIGVMEVVAGYQDASINPEACVQGMLDALAAAYPDAELAGWHGDEISIDAPWPGQAGVQAQVLDPAGETLFVVITCTSHPGDLLLADLLLQPNSVVENGETPAFPLVQAPGRGNTGRPWPDASTPAPGVVLFATRGLPVLAGETSIPFNCLDQESFELPSDPAPEGMGYFACDGQAANVDTLPVTLDLAGFALGCLPGLPVDPEAGACPDAPVRASHAQVLDTSTGEVDGATVTLDPGEYADLVLWFTLPEGLPPQDVLYIEGDQTFQAGTSYFAAGMGSRPRVRMTR